MTYALTNIKWPTTLLPRVDVVNGLQNQTWMSNLLAWSRRVCKNDHHSVTWYKPRSLSRRKYAS